MDISSISKHYELKSIQVNPSQLLLDPNNPRIVMDVKTNHKFSLEELPLPEVQSYILSVINKDAYHIAELIRGIRASGFIDKGDDMIVKRIPGTEKFLAVEGNRRTTAIKHLLAEVDSLKPAVRDTLTTLKVKEFVYKRNPELSEQAVIDILLGAIHITGRLPWGALERSYYIYNSYLRELHKLTGSSDFLYDVNCAREVASFFNLSLKGVRKEIMIYRVYEQLKMQDYDVEPRHFSLIDMAVSDRVLSDKYFELSSGSMNFSTRGLARFSALCVNKDKPVNNPGDFRSFSYIFKKGTQHEVDLIVNNEQSIDSVVERLDGRLGDREFFSQLEVIKDKLNCLEPAGFRGFNQEIEMIKSIKNLVDSKLLRLTKQAPLKN